MADNSQTEAPEGPVVAYPAGAAAKESAPAGDAPEGPVVAYAMGTPMDNSDQFLRSLEHGATLGLSEKTVSRETPEAQERFERFKREHPWLNVTGNVLGGGMLAAGLPLVAAGATAVAPEALTAGIADLAAPVTSAVGRFAAPAMAAAKNATAGLENYVNPLMTAGKAALTGGLWGGAYGLGDSQPGQRVADTVGGAKTGAEFGPVAQLGTEGALGFLGGVRKMAEPFIAPGTTARRVLQSMFPGTDIPPVPRGMPTGVPGSKPTMGQLTGNPDIAALEKQAIPDELRTRLGEQETATGATATGLEPNAQPGLAVHGVRSNVNDEIAAYQQRAADAKTAADAALGSHAAAPGTSAEDISTTARTQLDGIQNYYRDIERQKWDALDASNLTFPAMGKFKNGMNDFYEGLPPYARTPDVNNLMETIRGLPKEVSFDQIQQLRSDALSMARGISKDKFQQGVLNDFADALNNSVQDVDGLSPEAKTAWSDARAATKDRYDRFGNSLIGNYTGADNLDKAANQPSMTLKNILTGSGSTEKFADLLHAVTPEGGVPNQGVINSVKQYIASDLSDKLGGDVLSPDKVTAALKKYQPVISQHPDLQAAFGDIQDAQASAFAARQMADARTDIVQKSAAAKFMGADPGDPASISKAVGGILSSKTPRQDALDIANRMGTDQGAQNGMRRALVDKMMDGSADPHEFIDKNRPVLDVFFPDAAHQMMLDQIADASRQTANSAATPRGNNEDWKNLTSEHNYLGALVGKGTATGANVVGAGLGAGAGAIAAHTGLAEHLPFIGEFMQHAEGPAAEAMGVAGGAFGTKYLLNHIYNAPREKVVQIIKDGLLDPTGVGRKLTQPVNEVNSKEVARYVLPGIVSAATVKDAQKAPPQPGYADGGHVVADKLARAKMHLARTGYGRAA